MSKKLSSNQQKRAQKKRQKELKRRKKKQTRRLKNAGEDVRYDAPLLSDAPQTAVKMGGVQDPVIAARSGLGIGSLLDSLDLNQKSQSWCGKGTESTEKPIERIAAERWWDEYMKADGVGRMELTRKKLALLPFDQQDDYFPDAVFELETKLADDQYVGLLAEIEQQQPDLFAENLSWFASSMIFFYLNHGESEQLEHVVTVMAEKQQDVSENFFSLFSALRLAGHDSLASQLLRSAVECLPNSELMYWAVDEIDNWVWMDLLCHWLKQGSEQRQLDEILNRFPESLLSEKQNQDQLKESREFYREIGLRMAGQKQTEWSREQLLSSAKDEQWDQLRMLSGQWTSWLIKQQNLSPIAACEFRSLVFSATSKLVEKKAISKPLLELLNGVDSSHFDEVLATSFHFMSLAPFKASATIVSFRYLYDYFMELDLVTKKVRDKTFVMLDKLEQDVDRASADNFGFLPRYQNNSTEATTENMVD